VLTYIYPTRVTVSTPFYAQCPQCRGDIGNVKPTTRADTHFARQAFLFINVRNILFSIEMAQTNEEKSVLFKNIFETVVQNKHIIKDEERFKNMIRNKLKFLYENNEWTPANIYHIRIFGEQIV